MSYSMISTEGTKVICTEWFLLPLWFNVQVWHKSTIGVLCRYAASWPTAILEIFSYESDIFRVAYMSCQPLHKERNNTDRIVSSSLNILFDLHSLSNTNGRDVCHQYESQTSILCCQSRMQML